MKSKESIADFLARGGKITKAKPRMNRGGRTFSNSVRAKGSSNPAERAARAERKVVRSFSS